MWPKRERACAPGQWLPRHWATCHHLLPLAGQPGRGDDHKRVEGSDDNNKAAALDRPEGVKVKGKGEEGQAGQKTGTFEGSRKRIAEPEKKWGGRTLCDFGQINFWEETAPESSILCCKDYVKGCLKTPGN